jgi:hypothetical protein
VSDVRAIGLLSRADRRLLPATAIGFRIAAAAALVAFAVTLARLPTLLAAVFRFSDAPELTFISQGLATGHGPQLLPTQTSIGVIWFDELLQWAPFRMGIEYWTGPALALLMGAIMVRTAYLVLGRRGALWTCGMLLVLPPVVLWPLLFPDNHITTFVGAALLAWHLTLEMRDRGSVPRSVMVGIIAGICMVTDPQLAAFGLVPYVATFAVLRRRVTATQWQGMLITVIAALVAVGLSYAAMHFQGIRTVAIVPGGGGVSGIVRGFGLAMQMLTWTVGGGWYGDAISTVAVGLCVAAGLGGVALIVARLRQPSAAPPPAAPTDRLLPVYGLYWGLALVCLLGAFIFLGYGAGGAPTQGHYLVGCYFAATALVPAFAVRFGPGPLRGRGSHAGVAALIAAGAFTLFAVNTTVSIATFDASQYYDKLQVPASEDPLPTLLKNGLSRGYAGYWESYDLTWRSGGALSVWPLLGGAQACSGGAASLCPYTFAPRGEYSPTKGRTFIITPWTGESCGRSAPSVAIFGPPEAVITRGLYTISVYGYDVAARFSKNARLFC